MKTFEYTHSHAPVSSAVDTLYYNTNTQSLAVDLHDRLYRYEDVPFSEYADLVYADSAGREFSRIKREYGPGDFLGEYDDLDFEMVSANADSGVTTASGVVPKNLTYASNAKVTTSTTGNYASQPSEFISLNAYTDTKSPSKRKHEVIFEAAGAERIYSLEATSVDEAVEALQGVAEALDIDVQVRKVTVYFG